MRRSAPIALRPVLGQLEHMDRYFYVVDQDGREIPGSRRSLDYCRDWREIRAVEMELRSQIGEDCEIRDSVLDERRAQ